MNRKMYVSYTISICKFQEDWQGGERMANES